MNGRYLRIVLLICLVILMFVVESWELIDVDFFIVLRSMVLKFWCIGFELFLFLLMFVMLYDVFVVLVIVVFCVLNGFSVCCYWYFGFLGELVCMLFIFELFSLYIFFFERSI